MPASLVRIESSLNLESLLIDLPKPLTNCMYRKEVVTLMLLGEGGEEEAYGKQQGRKICV